MLNPLTLNLSLLLNQTMSVSGLETREYSKVTVSYSLTLRSFEGEVNSGGLTTTSLEAIDLQTTEKEGGGILTQSDTGL
jgi:hypothetical protein